MLQARLISSRELAPEVRHFDFELANSEELAFTPGQFVSVVHSVGEKEITRAYSIASPPNASQFSLCLNRVADGHVSPFLFSLSPGQTIDIKEPLGYFTLRHPGRKILFIGTGTGIAPFRSMLLEHLPKTHPHTTLLFGVRFERGLLYGDEFHRMEQEHPTFRFMPTVSRPSGDWKGRTGRVQAHIEEALGSEDRALVDVYICGLKEMVDDVRTLLKQMGFDRKQLIYEKYD